ncbi:Short-chain dehydrogenase reductase sdr protein [Lasiodiplodia theobromae]|uniref:Short-chain dehydrogenase reductase sdr protein n=1 Tax=Lasiodiplodia theobromae TaxID=45133 RepID=UPI0015C3C38C|nr:Short-chain dehydrogenase reductase sdr protein [Lasiodiplodia theobromae]KAF4536381.1 Short-chain dehydrogenase reductase sdr protein [Lasiodiplodia theobromae]
MTGARELTKRYNLRPRPPDAATDAEHLQTTAPAATNGNHHSNNGGATEANSTDAHMSKHIQRNKRNIFRFADLPAEIRNEIYNLSLKTDFPIALCTFDSLINGEHKLRQKIYSDGPKALFVFLSSHSSTPKGWLQELTFSYWASSPPYFHGFPPYDQGTEGRAFLLPALTALNGAANLKNFHLEFSIERIQNQYWTSRRTAMRLYSFMHFWLHALSKEKSSISRAVELIDVKIVDLSYDEFKARDDQWSFPGYAKHVDKSGLRTSMLREHLVQCMDGRLTRQMLSELDPIRPERDLIFHDSV